MAIVVSDPTAFSTAGDLEAWLQVHHATKTELWVRVFKKGSGTAIVTWNDLVIAGLIWGWIDGQRNSLDDVSFVQRMTPRRAKSMWSKKNCEHAERLITEGRMQPSGLAQVQAARDDGRWDNAYAGSADMVMPEDLLEALRHSPVAEAAFAALDRKQLYHIYHRLYSAVKPTTRAKRIADIVESLGIGAIPS